MRGDSGRARRGRRGFGASGARVLRRSGAARASARDTCGIISSTISASRSWPGSRRSTGMPRNWAWCRSRPGCVSSRPVAGARGEGGATGSTQVGSVCSPLGPKMQPGHTTTNAVRFRMASLATTWCRARIQRRRWTAAMGMTIEDIADKVRAGDRVTAAEALALYRERVHAAARAAGGWCPRAKASPKRVVTYIIDRNVNYTNVCVAKCNFCAFYREVGSPEGYVLGFEELFRKIDETAGGWRRAAAVARRSQSGPAADAGTRICSGPSKIATRASSCMRCRRPRFCTCRDCPSCRCRRSSTA